MSPAVAELLKVAEAASHALRSYQYGNSSPELAEEMVDALEVAIAGVKSENPAYSVTGPNRPNLKLESSG